MQFQGMHGLVRVPITCLLSCSQSATGVQGSASAPHYHVAALPYMQGNLAALQHQVEELLVEKDQLLKVITEQQHDAATLQDELLQIAQLKRLIVVLQQQNKQLAKELQEQGAKVLCGCMRTCGLTAISTTERQRSGGDCLT